LESLIFLHFRGFFSKRSQSYLIKASSYFIIICILKINLKRYKQLLSKKHQKHQQVKTNQSYPPQNTQLSRKVQNTPSIKYLLNSLLHVSYHLNIIKCNKFYLFFQFLVKIKVIKWRILLPLHNYLPSSLVN